MKDVKDMGFIETIKDIPNRIIIPPAICRRSREYATITLPIRPTDAPSIIKIMEKPSTKKRLWKSVGHRLVLVSDSIAVVPARLAIYAGTSGNTHGEMNDSSPALKAIK